MESWKLRTRSGRKRMSPLTRPAPKTHDNSTQTSGGIYEAVSTGGEVLWNLQMHRKLFLNNFEKMLNCYSTVLVMFQLMLSSRVHPLNQYQYEQINNDNRNSAHVLHSIRTIKRELYPDPDNIDDDNTRDQGSLEDNEYAEMTSPNYEPNYFQDHTPTPLPSQRSGSNHSSDDDRTTLPYEPAGNTEEGPRIPIIPRSILVHRYIGHIFRQRNGIEEIDPIQRYFMCTKKWLYIVQNQFFLKQGPLLT